MKNWLLIVPVLCMTLVAGCSQQSAQTMANVLTAVLNVAQAEETVLPAQDAAVLTPWVELGKTLDTQLNTCIAGATGMTSKSKTLACFNTFATGLLNPVELAQLRIISSPAQKKIQLYVTAIVTGVNVAMAAFGGTVVPIPVVASTPTTSAELAQLRAQIGY